MLPKWHVLFGFLFSILVFWIFPEIGIIGFSLIFLSSFLIDVDHYLFYAVTQKDWNLRNSHKWFIEKHLNFNSLSYDKKIKRLKQKGPWPMIFHGIEAIIILGFLALFFPIFKFILIGFLFHEFLDFINIVYSGYSLTHIGSQTYNLIVFLRKRIDSNLN